MMHDTVTACYYKKSFAANTKGNARQQCMCEGPMFHLDSMTNDA